MQSSISNVLVLGAGKIGRTIAAMLAQHYRLQVTLADQLAPQGDQADLLISNVTLNVVDSDALREVISAHDIVINALPFFLASHVATIAAAVGVHYFDLTEDVAATAAIRKLAGEASAVMMPQCGLAPGVIGMLGGHLSDRFDQLHDLRLRVGALTRHATNVLRYNFTWSVDGVINEYCNPCEAIVHGKRVLLQPMEGHENFVLDADNFEAFNTSGGLGTLCETLEGKVHNLDYKTIRYPGHRDAMSFLLLDMRLADRRELLREVLEHAVPHSREDMVILFASATGRRHGRLEQETRTCRIYGATLRGEHRTAIELTTAAGVVGAVELLRDGRLPARGFVGQEQIPLRAFLDTRVGHYFSGLGTETPGLRNAQAMASANELEFPL